MPSERAMCANELDKTTSETLFNKYTPTKCDATPINTKRTVEVLNKNQEPSTLINQLKLKLDFNKVKQKINLQHKSKKQLSLPSFAVKQHQ